MISDELKKNYSDVADLFRGYNTDILPVVLTKKDIEDYMRKNGIEPDTYFLPSDICYNHTTKPLGDYDFDFENAVHVFEYVGRNKYKVLGEGYPYTGLVIRKRRSDRKEIIVGEWFNGHLIKWDNGSLMDIETLSSKESELIQSISEEIDSLDIKGDEKKSLVKIRVNQGIFRNRLLKRYSHCCLCGVASNSFLIASHIKPWAECEPEEKLDVNNGFLFCPNHDALFDKGLISFEDNGSIIISEKLKQTERVFMNVGDKFRIEVCEENKYYLKYHRDAVFDK